MKLIPDQRVGYFLKLPKLDFTNITLGSLQPFNTWW